MPFDPSQVAVKNGRFFGFPYEEADAAVVLLPVPWDVTTSYRDGTSRGPRAMLEASYQLDFTSPYKERAWETKIATIPEPAAWFEKNRSLRMLAKELIHFQEQGGLVGNDGNKTRLLEQVNAEGARFHASLEQEAARLLTAGKKLFTLGGDHSVSLGPIRAHARHHGSLSVLHLDAHADLRDAYEGFTHSHASIMHHVVGLENVDALVQVGIRDSSPDELRLASELEKIHSFYDWDLKRAAARGESWHSRCEKIIQPLSKNVYVSFDIDGLDPRFCPNTGTPVPGGLELAEALYLFEQVVASGRTIVGADLVEVAPGNNGDEWDANVGARIVYQLAQLLTL